MKCKFILMMLLSLLLLSTCGGKESEGGLASRQKERSGGATGEQDGHSGEENAEPEKEKAGLEEEKEEDAALEKIRDGAGEKGCALSAAFLGVAESFNDFLESPEGKEVLNEYPFIQMIPLDKRIAHPAGGQEIYCIVPTDPEAAVTVTACGYDDEGETLFDGHAGENNILLLSGNVSEIRPDLRVTVAGESGTMAYEPCLSGEDGSLCLPPEGGVEDFTPYSLFFDREQLEGTWRGMTAAELGGGVYLELCLYPGGETLYRISRDDLIAEYEGYWQFIDGEGDGQLSRMCLDLTMAYGVEDNNMYGEYGAGTLWEEIHGVWDAVLDGDELQLIYINQGDPLLDGHDGYDGDTIVFYRY